MKILVTGGTGFVGTAVAKRWLAGGHDVAIMVRDASYASDLAERGTRVHQVGLDDPNAIVDAAKGCEVVVHCASAPPHATDRELQWTNVAGTENVVNAARHAGCERIVLVSCADATLSNVDRVHWNEDRGLLSAPLGTFAKTKQLAEDVALTANGSGIEVVALRPGWIWGAGDTARLPELAREALDGGIVLPGGGEALLATTHISNLVDAIESAAEVAKAAGRSYYVTDAGFHEAREFFGSLCRAIGAPPPRSVPYALAYGMGLVRQARHLPGLWAEDVARRGRSSVFDVQRAHNELDYQPKVDLADGMKELGEWAAEIGGLETLATMDSP